MPDTNVIDPEIVRHVGIRDGKPAIRVKDHTAWYHDRRTHDLIVALEAASGDPAEMAYEMAREYFWTNAASIAGDHGYSPQVYSAGRSGGWLILEDRTYFLDYVTDDAWTIPAADDDTDEGTHDEYAEAIRARDRFLRFAQEIIALMEASETAYIDNLRAAVAELESRREAAIVKGDN